MSTSNGLSALTDPVEERLFDVERAQLLDGFINTEKNYFNWTQEQADYVMEWLYQVAINKNLSNKTAAVAIFIAEHFNWRCGYSDPSINDICKHTNISRSVVLKSRKSLIDNGYLFWTDGDIKTKFRTRFRLAFPNNLETMQMNRVFERTSINVPNSRAIPAYLIRCSKCGVTEKVSSNTHGGSMAPEGVAAKFRNKGWSISTRGNNDVCPSCQERKKHSLKESNVVELVRAEPPREMGKEDRRVIFSKINDVYIDEKTGYSKEWDDKKVADDLGVPLAWVREIREEHFGIEGIKIDIEREVHELRNRLDEGCNKIDDLCHVFSKIQESKDFDIVIKFISTHIDNISKMSGHAKNVHQNYCDMHERLKCIEHYIKNTKR